MNEQEITPNDEETAWTGEHYAAVATDERGASTSEPGTSPGQQERPLAPPSSRQPVQPTPWQGYPPATPPPMSSQSGTYTYPPLRKRPARWPWVVLTLSLLFVLLIGGAVVLFGVLGYVGMSSTIETQHFNVTAHPTLVLNNDTGSIHVRTGGSGNGITIQATKHSNPWAGANDLRVNYAHNQQANSVTVTVDRPNTMTFFNAARVDFDVAVPPSAALHITTNTGSIDVSGVNGPMMLTSNTGSLAVSSATLSGSSSLTTNTGSVTFNGAIDRSGSYRFATNTGSVNVTLPAESAFHVDASTDTGSINTNFAGISVQHNQGLGASATGDVGSQPQATVSLRTNTGSLNLLHQ